MALNLIEKVAAPASKNESRKRKRSDDTGSGSGSHYGPTAPLAHSARQGEPARGLSRDRSRDPGLNRRHTYSQDGSASLDNRRFTNTNNYHPYRGRAGPGSVSSRGTSGVSAASADNERARNNRGTRGFRGGFRSVVGKSRPSIKRPR